MPKCRSGAPHVLGDFCKLMLLTSLQSTGAAFVEAFHSGRKVHFFIDSGSLLLYEYKIDDAEGKVLAKRPSKGCNRHTVHLVYNQKRTVFFECLSCR